MFSISVCYLIVFVNIFINPNQALRPFIDGASGRIEAQVAVLCDVQSQQSPQQQEKQSSLYYGCQYQYQNQQNGKWHYNKNAITTDDNKLLDRVLSLCQMMYTDREISNVVESTNFVEIDNWCYTTTSNQQQSAPCNRKEWIKPYRCLEAPFQSDALLVPDSCLFDHLHHPTECRPMQFWNATSSATCSEKHAMRIHSFAMLLPCGLSLFSGVEFVCCPSVTALPRTDIDTADVQVNSYKTIEQRNQNFELQQPDEDSIGNKDRHNRTVVSNRSILSQATRITDGLPSSSFGGNNHHIHPNNYQNNWQSSSTISTPLTTIENEDDDDDDWDYGNEDDEIMGKQHATVYNVENKRRIVADTTITTAAQTTTTPVTETATSEVQHSAHLQSERNHYEMQRNNLNEAYRQNVSQIMKKWSDLEKRYEEMKAKDGRIAEEFKQRMTMQFQQTIERLQQDERIQAEHLSAEHDERIVAAINHQKKHAIGRFVKSLDDNPPNKEKLKRYIRKVVQSLYKDRHHTISRYYHRQLMTTNSASVVTDQTDQRKSILLEHLYDTERTINQSLQMLVQRYPVIGNEILDSLAAYMKQSKENDKAQMMKAGLFDSYKEMMPAAPTTDPTFFQQDWTIAKATSQQHRKPQLENDDGAQVIQQHTAAEQADSLIPNNSDELQDDDELHSVKSSSAAPAASYFDGEAAVILQQYVPPIVAHSSNDHLKYKEPIYVIRNDALSSRSEAHENGSVRKEYLVAAFAVFTVLSVVVVGTALISHRKNDLNRRRRNHSGFVKVNDDAYTTEDRHVANMQINGYENPTYKYFDATAIAAK